MRKKELEALVQRQEKELAENSRLIREIVTASPHLTWRRYTYEPGKPRVVADPLGGAALASATVDDVKAVEDKLTQLTQRLDADFPKWDVTDEGDPRTGKVDLWDVSTWSFGIGSYKKDVRTRYGRRKVAEFNSAEDARKYADKLTKRSAE